MNLPKITTSTKDPSKSKLDALMIVTRSFEKNSPPWKKLGSVLSKICSQAAAAGRFSGKEGSVLVFPTLGQTAPSTIVLVGLGKAEEVGVQHRCIGKAVRQLQAHQIKSLGIAFATNPISVETVIIALEEATYHFDSFLAEPKKSEGLSSLVLFSGSELSHHISRGTNIASAVRYARALANQPPNLFSPATLATEAQKLARRRKMRCKVWNHNQLKREGFGGILAVGQGSANPPRFIQLEYRGARASQAPVVVIGKAITFDTGGISIKPSERMDEMKFDKCGGIAVLGIMDAVAALRLPINVTGLISSAENMPSANAYRPGDLVKSLSGKYIEVLNTDAEGRIVLADALTYAQRLKPRAMVDLATLTGACIVCFGNECAALLGNQDKIQAQLLQASKATGEKAWSMPMWKEYQDLVKSDVGYVKNTAGRNGGTITAACFLNAFVDSKIPWAHIDIAGTAWTTSNQPHRAKGATAFGVRLVAQWIQSLAGR